MQKQFQEQFGLICTEFDKVFKQLFGGGKGTLELMEEEDVLEDGNQESLLSRREKNCRTWDAVCPVGRRL